MPIGGSRGYPTENQPLSYAQQYQQPNPAAAPPSSVYSPGAPAYNPTTPSATIGGGTPYAGVQSPYSQPAGVQSAPTAANGAGGNVIGGTLPWGGGGANMFQGMSGDPATTLANLGTNYANAYNSSLAMNQANYGNILAGYQQTAQNQAAGQAATQAGYGTLSNNVLGGIAGIGSDQLALINRNYAGQSGAADQNLINSGLGNSTVRSSVQRGIGLDQSLAQNNLANSIAQTKAGYQSNIGLAGLGYQGQSVRDNTALAGRQLDWMNSVNAGYPDAAQYGNLAQQAGAAIQSNANRAQIDRLASQNSDLGAQVRQAAVLGGSGGTAPGTGGRLPLSSINYAGGASSPGVGTSPPNFGSSFIQSGAPGVGGGGAMQNVQAGRPVAGGMLTPEGFGSGLPAGQNLMPAGSQAAAQAAAGWGAGSVYGQPVDQGGGWADVGAALGGDQGGYDPNSNPFGFGGDFASQPSYDPNANPFGFGTDFTSQPDPNAQYDPWYNPFGFGPDAGYAYSPAATDSSDYGDY